MKIFKIIVAVFAVGALVAPTVLKARVKKIDCLRAGTLRVCNAALFDNNVEQAVVRAEVDSVKVPRDEKEIDFDAAVLAAATKRITNKKCLRVTKNLRVCGNEQIDGDLNVAGTITATSIITTNSTAAGGLLAYGAGANTGAVLVLNGEPVPFNVNTSSMPGFPSLGVTTAINGTITVANAGVYSIDAQVEGVNQDNPTGPIRFQLTINGDPYPVGFFSSETPLTYTSTDCPICTIRFENDWGKYLLNKFILVLGKRFVLN